MTFQATPGYGASVATDIKGGAHHQHVITHKDVIKDHVNPAVSVVTYVNGKYVGGEMIFNNATRFTGDFSHLTQIQVFFKRSSTIGDMDLILYSDSLVTPPVDKNDFSIDISEFANVLGIVSIPASAYKDLAGSFIATISTSLLVQSGTGTTTIKGALVSRSNTIKPFSVDSILVSVVFERV
jgi:hypothetical protein